MGKRLCQIVVAAGLIGLQLVLLLRLGGQEQNGRGAALADLAAGGYAVQPRHHNVHQHQTDARLLPHVFHRRKAVLRLGDPIAARFQQNADDVPDVRLVVHHEDQGALFVLLFHIGLLLHRLQYHFSVLYHNSLANAALLRGF